jgi:glutathione S-transferase
MMTLHGFPYSHNTRKVLAAIHELDLTVELKIVDLITHQTRTPEYLALNPTGRSPTLVDDEFVLWESNAILIHLACLEPRRLWPAERSRHMDICRWLFWQSCHWDAALDIIGLETFVRQLEGTGDPNPHLMAYARPKVAEYASVLNGHLDKQRFICGDSYGIADFSIASSMMYYHFCDYELADYRNIWRWYDDLWAASPGWRASEPDWKNIGLPSQDR